MLPISDLQLPCVVNGAQAVMSDNLRYHSVVQARFGNRSRVWVHHMLPLEACFDSTGVYCVQLRQIYEQHCTELEELKMLPTTSFLIQQDGGGNAHSFIASRIPSLPSTKAR